MYQVEVSPTRPVGDLSTIRPALGRAPAMRAPLLANSLTRTRTRSRLETELRAIAVEAAVTRVCDSSLATLAEMLDSRLDAAPPGIRRRLEGAEARHDAGWIC